ncbi:MAG: DUF1003 domain-containing protein [Comamonadaceae bacterium]|nr:MAG: DUF1003 domain-containing protein [Comamonadaceae bacterium]
MTAASATQPAPHALPLEGGPAPSVADKDYRSPQSVDDVTAQNVRVMRELEHAAMLRRTMADRVACFVATFCGTMTFVWIHVVLFGVWIAFNSVPGLQHPDPFPFTFLTLMVSLEAIFLSAFILISQNYEMRLTERRSQLDLQINLLSEQENTKMLSLLEQIARKLGVADNDDPTVKVLEEATRPERLVEQIERAYRADARDEEAGTKLD